MHTIAAAMEMPELIDPTSPEQCALEAGLHYVTDDATGYTRKLNGKGYVYFDTRGNKITNQSTINRINNLRIPHIWEKVWISPNPKGHLQATGIDTRNRKQYRYHSEWSSQRSCLKFSRMKSVGEALPALRKQIEEDLNRKQYDKRKVLATVAAVLDSTLIRIGNAAYEKTNSSYGLTTLRDKHVKESKNGMMITFAGKKGVEQEIPITDKRLQKLVKKCKEIPGYKLFQYYQEDGSRCPVDSGDVNNYLREATSLDITAKDFRTWGGSIEALSILIDTPPAKDEKEAKQAVTNTIKGVAERLGNTVAVCRKYYVHPLILNSYTEGKLHDFVEKWSSLNRSGSRQLSTEEKILLKFLEEEA
jgi:DNA topoisomerase I